ncbi:hypothetical protein, partial [Streptomyces acidicola]|uniref:hypothetical protein n=1 Tax=Streptomyces acidicola TaxID=2596892 RepID=UPI00389A5E23
MHHQTAYTSASRPTIVALCGSTRYWDALAEANLYETAASRIVLALGCNMKQLHPLWEDPARADRLKQQLDELHRRKIDLADEVLIVNPGSYTGDSTGNEIDYARSLGKPIRYPRYVFRGPARGPLASGPGMAVPPCRTDDLGGGATGPERRRWR